jgi:A/G-specific adenine glycosylase
VSVENISNALGDWYAANARTLPWRMPPGSPIAAPPYHVWLSEIMLQQTTVAAVIPYFRRFIERWPTVEALAAAPDEAVMGAWAGLGYYARARNMLATARAVAAMGRFPEAPDDLRRLPGIGAYTSAAIAAIAFGRRAAVIDGNVERVVARLFAIDTPLPAARARLGDAAAALTPTERPGDHAQAMMDLGATVCTPRRPTCAACPLAIHCRALTAGTPEAFPVKPPRIARPERRGTAFWLESDNAVLLVRRPASGLLGGMLALPSGPWVDASEPGPALAGAPIDADWTDSGRVRHIFTHFALDLGVVAHRHPRRPDCAGQWWPLDSIEQAGMPTLFIKAAARAMAMRTKQAELFTT